jgi:flagellar protein FliO/FliZ
VRFSRLCIAALTLAAGCLASPAQALADAVPASSIASPGITTSLGDSPQSSPISSVVAPESATPLALRPNQPGVPLQLSDESSRLTLGWKLALVTLLLGCIAYFFRRRSRAHPANADLVIVRRTSIGLRSELLVVNVDGQRLLLGITPNSIHTLAVLDVADEPLSAPSAAAPEAPTPGPSFGAMHDAIEDVHSPDRTTKRSSSPNHGEVPGQARGLTFVRRRR